MSPSRASTPTPRSVAQRAASFNGSGRDATDARTANQANGGKPEQPSTVHRAGFSAASFILLTTLPIISAWSHSLRIHFGPYPALAITIAASAVLGCLLADRRHQLASMYASLRAHPAGKEAAALIGVLGAAYVACAFMPLAFRLLHGIMNGLPLVGGVAVYAVLLWGTTVLGVATVWTMAVMSWDVTRVVHGAVVKVSRYVVAPDATADASAPPPPVEMQTRSRGGGLGGGRYHHQHHHHHQRHVVGGGFRVVNSSDSSEDSSDHEEDDDDDGGQGVEAAFEALRTTTNRTTTTKTNSTATFVGSDGKFKATLGETSQRQQQRESSMYLGKGKMPSFYDDDGGGGFRGSVPRPAEDDRRSMVGF
ncbi:hypothetical protein HKX48_000066 [Thoreauomyces humboldtii]|nr:hypothetical protein HKX48_000066 [Thoreauomyces humboldtii]